VHRSHQLRRVGWLLTPLVVWAASFLGAWIGAVIAHRTDTRSRGLVLMVGGALLAAAAAAVVWLVLLRRGLRSDRQGGPAE
jgi:uncharacterized membrane protein YfcA